MLYLWTKFQCLTFLPSKDIKQNVLLSSFYTIDDAINFKIYIRSSPKTMADGDKKSEGQKYKILNISRTTF